MFKISQPNNQPTLPMKIQSEIESLRAEEKSILIRLRGFYLEDDDRDALTERLEDIADRLIALSL